MHQLHLYHALRLLLLLLLLLLVSVVLVVVGGQFATAAHGELRLQEELFEVQGRRGAAHRAERTVRSVLVGVMAALELIHLHHIQTYKHTPSSSHQSAATQPC